MEPELKRAVSPRLVAPLLAGLLASTAACKHDNDEPASGLAQPESKRQAEKTPVTQPMNFNAQIEFSIEDLARRLDVPTESIKVSGARRVTWRSGALGCPEPGMNYTAALVPGSVIYLQVDNTIHAYHGKLGAAPFYCPRDRAELPVLDDELDPT